MLLRFCLSYSGDCEQVGTYTIDSFFGWHLHEMPYDGDTTGYMKNCFHYMCLLYQAIINTNTQQDLKSFWDVNKRSLDYALLKLKIF